MGISYTHKFEKKNDDNPAMPPKADSGETEQQSQNPDIEQAAKQSQSNLEVQPGAC